MTVRQFNGREFGLSQITDTRKEADEEKQDLRRFFTSVKITKEPVGPKRKAPLYFVWTRGIRKKVLPKRRR